MSEWRQLTSKERRAGMICENCSTEDKEVPAHWQRTLFDKDCLEYLCDVCHHKLESKPMEKPTCNSCEYYSGLCRHRSPNGIKSDGSPNWPYVNPSEWCGKHQDFPKWIGQQKEKQ